MCSKTLEFLFQRYGPTLTLVELAEVLKRKPQGLRSALSLREEPWATHLHDSKVHIGRRVYFPTIVVAGLLDGVSCTQEKAGTSKQPQALTQSEIASLRQDMKQSVEWAQAELRCQRDHPKNSPEWPHGNAGEGLLKAEQETEARTDVPSK